MSTSDEARAKALATYDAAADRYDDPVNSFWERFGRSTVARLRLQPGAHVLDVCCGSGASALAAAESVGAAGSVLGIDLSPAMLALARDKAAARGLGNVEFRSGDMLDLGACDGAFDAVVCVFGIFFVPDMASAARTLWRALRPGGRLAITTWGPRFFEPASTAFWGAVREVRPDLYRGFNPWDRVCDPSSLRAVLEAAGICGAEICAEPGEHPLPTPEAWWAAVLGSGYRGTFELLDADDRHHVREANLAYMRKSGILSVEANVVYAIAGKGPAS